MTGEPVMNGAIWGRTLWEQVVARAEATPSALMARDEIGRTMTFAQYRERAERAAAGLHELGIRSGDVVSWELPTWLESMVLVAALARLGAVQNPLIPIYRGREVAFICRQAGSTLIVVPSEWKGFSFESMAREIAESQPGLKVLVVDREGASTVSGSPAGASTVSGSPAGASSVSGSPAGASTVSGSPAGASSGGDSSGGVAGGAEPPGEPWGLPEGDPAGLPAPPPTPDDPADLPVRWLFYTSGTTADPKGAQHTDATVMAAARAMSAALATTDSDVNVLVFPFTHIGGINWLMAGLADGFPEVIAESFVPDQTVDLIATNGVTLAGSGTPFHAAYLAAHRANPGGKLFASVRAFPGGGAPKPPQLHYDLVAEIGGVGIVSGYGLTECPILAMASVGDPTDKQATTEGRASAGVTIKVVTLDGKPAGPSEEGEIRVRGPQLFRGYLDTSLDTEAFDGEGFFRTGDLGKVDPEGYVTITGRLKDVIIRKGENISAKEVEDLLYKHPKVADVAVIGLPDPATGERACAVISCKDPGDGLSFDEMSAFLKDEGLMIQKVPEQLEIVETVPRNPAGKILKHQLREKFSAGA